MKRSLLFGLVILVILSFTTMAAKPPSEAGEKPLTEFYGKESCVVVKEGEKVNQDGWIKYRGRELACTLTSTDGTLAGTAKVEILGPWAKAYGQEHTVVAQTHLEGANSDWLGYRWGTIDKEGNITWMNGWAWTPEEARPYLRHIAWMRYDGENVYGWYESLGTKS